MRTKIRIEGKYYRPVPWHRESYCDGCAFDHGDCINNESNDNPCDDGNEFSGHILIRHTKEAMAEYVAKKLGGVDADSVD